MEATYMPINKDVDKDLMYVCVCVCAHDIQFFLLFDLRIFVNSYDGFNFQFLCFSQPNPQIRMEIQFVQEWP